MDDQTKPELATRLGVIQPYTMILDQSAHLDWDWIRNFAQNFWYGGDEGVGVQVILDRAIDYLKQFNRDGSRPYFYSICEMGFLQKYIEENPSKVAAIEMAGDNFQVIGGGITSPDCLVCSGEAFIRNYLVGHRWLSQALPRVRPRLQCLIPDDFGQGPELPVLLQALGFGGVCFARLLDGALKEDLQQNGLDFVWRASDSSEVVAHWIGALYNLGHNFNKDGARAINNFTAVYNPTSAPPTQYAAAVTPAMYFPVEDDFSMPVAGLLDMLSQWNDNEVRSGGARDSNVQVTTGTFDGLIGALAPSREVLQKRAPYNGTPYWTGYYASRPALKILHYTAVRALVAAEIFALMTQPGNGQLKNMLPGGFWKQLDETWADFAPSTHHDYVCGTAIDSIYATEQLPMLQAVAARACGLRAAALNALAGMTPSQKGGDQILVANSLGFARHGLAEIANVRTPGATSVSFDAGGRFPLQPSAEGGMLLLTSTVPSLGYVRASLSAWQQPAQGPAASITQTGTNGYLLENDRLTATISEAVSWGIASMTDNANGRSFLGAAPAGEAPGNHLVFYQDGGDIYRFGNEVAQPFTAENVTITSTGPGLGAVVLESGPLRVRLRTTVLVTVGTGETRTFTREYALVAGEPFLRMSTTGAAPMGGRDPHNRYIGYSVMTRFRLGSAVASITHGTAGHWTSVQPNQKDPNSVDGYWTAPVFQATHDFLIPQDSNGNTLAAIYHEAVPAWAFEPSGNLIGCILRNTPENNGYGAAGSDPAPHTQHYALRVSSDLGAPGTGAPLREALAYNTPLRAVKIPAGDRNSPYQNLGMNSARWSLAAVTDPAAGDPTAILTVAKPGTFDPTSLILRVYQPTNTGQEVHVTLGGGAPTNVSVVTAAEGVWSRPVMPIQPTEGGFRLQMSAAIATVQVDGMGLPAARAPER